MPSSEAEKVLGKYSFDGGQIKRFAYDLETNSITVTFQQNGDLKHLTFLWPFEPKEAFKLTKTSEIMLIDISSRQLEDQKVSVEFYADHSITEFVAASVE